MEIGIVGSGRIGATVAKLAADRGHSVKIANSRGPESLTALVGTLGDRAEATDVQGATAADLIVVAIPFKAIGVLPPSSLAGRVVADASNYYPDRDGQVPIIDNGEKTSSGMLADHVPMANVVKAFNTMQWKALEEQGDTGKPADERLALYVAGDDRTSKQMVANLMDEFGFTAIDAGGLDEGGRKLQPGSPVYGADLKAAEAHAQLG